MREALRTTRRGYQSTRWDGITQTDSLTEEGAQLRHALADAAKTADWPTVFTVLSDHREWINATRPSGSAWYSPLHQAAWHGAPVAVIDRLIGCGAWRTHQNAYGERPVDVAERRGHRHLLGALMPQYKRHVPVGVLLKLQARFHAVILDRAERLVREQRLRLPELEPLLEVESSEMWFSVPGMYGGFAYRLAADGVQLKLVSESWCRVVEGSGQRHSITPRACRLVEEGFV